MKDIKDIIQQKKISSWNDLYLIIFNKNLPLSNLCNQKTKDIKSILGKEKNNFKNSINNLSLPKELKLLYHEIVKIKDNDAPIYDLFKILLKSMVDNSNSETKNINLIFVGNFNWKIIALKSKNIIKIKKY